MTKRSQGGMMSTPEAVSGGLTGALERGIPALLSWTQDGTLLSGTEYAAARSVPPSALVELEARSELFSLEIYGARWYPSALLALTVDEAAVLCRALAGDEPTRQLTFIVRKHGALAGETVTAAVRQGRLARVLQLARDWRTDGQ
jgi:hypothetical protein